MNVVRYSLGSAQPVAHRGRPAVYPPPRRLDETETGIAASDWTPAVDIKEETERFVITADIPVSIRKTSNCTWKTHSDHQGRAPTETQSEREGYKRIERVRGNFYRRFSLPDTANADAISARSQLASWKS